MNLLDENAFAKVCGKMVPLRRNMSIFDGDMFQCACGRAHAFDSVMVNVLTEGFNGRFVVVCPNNDQLLSLLKTKMRWGLFYQGLEYLAGHQTD